MKKLILLALLVFSITLSKAQYVTIPDANFRSFLKSKFPYCFNASNQMDTTCSSILNATALSCISRNITSLEGIQYLKSLLDLNCSGNPLTELPSLPANLTNLLCSNNQLTELPSLPASLTFLQCDNNQLTELSSLPSSLTYIHCGYNQLTELPSLPSSLTILACYENQLTELPSLPSSLIILSCSGNQLTELPNLPSSLENLECNNNQLTELPNLPSSLENLECSQNQLIELPSLPSSLTSLGCGGNQLTELPSLPSSLKHLEGTNNQLSELPILPSSLYYLECNNNQLTELPSLPSSLTFFYCDNNELMELPSLPSSLEWFVCNGNQLTELPNLPSRLLGVFCSVNQITELPSLPSSIVHLDCGHNPLTCLPILPENLEILNIKSTKIKCIPNEVDGIDIDTILPICTNPSDICRVDAYANGIVYNDHNNDGIWNSALEPIISEQIISVEPNNWHSISDGNGQYLVKLDTAINNTWSCTPPKYTTVNPASYSFNPDTIGLIEGDYNFGIHYIPNVNDLETAISSTVARPGFTTNIAVSVNNVGTANQSNITVKLKKPNGYDVITTSVIPTNVVDDTLVWEDISIPIFESANFYVELHVPVSNTIGTEIIYETWANGTQGDTTPLNNYATWTDTVRGSYDPNDKLVSKTSLAPNYEVEKDRLIYTIRFQNTGTDTAFYVRVKDEIPDNLNISTLRVINASHDYQLIVREKNIVEFVFPNIFLPDSGTNEPKSHGFVQFAIQPKPGLPINTKIENNAAIYFDYNAPVITNFAITEVKLITGIANNKNLDFKLFPNPTNGQLTVDLPFTGNGSWILSDISGRQIEMSSIENGIKTFNLNLNDLPNGTYFLSIQLGNQVSTAKVMKL